MNHDLDAALRDLAAGAAAAHRDRTDADADLVLAPTVRRVRRRRRVRGAAAATGSLVVVAGLVLGGIALAEEPDPQPAGPTPTPSVTTPAPRPSTTPTPDPTSTRAAVVLATGDPALPFGTCGSLVATAPAAPVDPAFTASVQVREPTVAAGGHAVVTTWVGLTPDRPTTYAGIRPGGAEIAVVQQGVVVGTASYSAGEHTMHGGFQGEIEVSTDWLSLTACTPESQLQVVGGVPLPAGEYQLLPWSDVISLGTDDARLRVDGGPYLDLADAVAAYGTPVTAVGTSVRITVVGEADAVEPVPGTGAEQVVLPSPALPLCGDPALPLDTTNPLRLATDLSATLRIPDLAEFSARVTYQGGGRASFAPGAVWAAVLSDGRVVGQSPLFYEADQQIHLAPGIPLDLTGRIEQIGACTAGDVLYSATGTLPAGTYEVVIGLELVPVAGSADGGSGWTSLVSEPRTLVID